VPAGAAATLETLINVAEPLLQKAAASHRNDVITAQAGAAFDALIARLWTSTATGAMRALAKQRRYPQKSIVFGIKPQREIQNEEPGRPGISGGRCGGYPPALNILFRASGRLRPLTA
jgi:hypothetical protein